MSRFTRQDIEHLGDLSRIALKDDVKPTANPVPLEAYMRPDEPAVPLIQEEALSGAPARENGMFVAPQILAD